MLKEKQNDHYVSPGSVARWAVYSFLALNGSKICKQKRINSHLLKVLGFRAFLVLLFIFRAISAF